MDRRSNILVILALSGAWALNLVWDFFPQEIRLGGIVTPLR